MFYSTELRSLNDFLSLTLGSGSVWEGDGFKEHMHQDYVPVSGHFCCYKAPPGKIWSEDEKMVHETYFYTAGKESITADGCETTISYFHRSIDNTHQSCDVINWIAAVFEIDTTKVVTWRAAVLPVLSQNTFILVNAVIHFVPLDVFLQSRASDKQLILVADRVDYCENEKLLAKRLVYPSELECKCFVDREQFIADCFVQLFDFVHDDISGMMYLTTEGLRIVDTRSSCASSGHSNTPVCRLRLLDFIHRCKEMLGSEKQDRKDAFIIDVLEGIASGADENNHLRFQSGYRALTGCDYFPVHNIVSRNDTISLRKRYCDHVESSVQFSNLKRRFLDPQTYIIS